MEMRGTNALVTGGSRGIGAAIALSLAHRGVNVAVNYRADRQGADAVAAEIQKAGPHAVIVRADVAQSEDVEHMVATVLREFSSIDILVNNAGVGEVPMPIEKISEAQWDRVIAVNLKGVFNCCRTVVPLMRDRRDGKIINVSSIAAMRGTSGLSYVASKAGVIGLTMCLAREMAPFGVTVNCVAPGLTDTEMLKPYLTDEQRNNIEREVPMGWLGRPEDVAQAVMFLLDAEYVTGETINVSGGRHIAM